MITPKRLFSYEEFMKIYSQVPRLCVDVIIKKDNGLILTQRKIKPYQGMWHLPGGTVFIQDSLKETVKRVAMEEVNLEVEIVKMMGVMEFFNEDGGRHSVSIVYLVEYKSGDIEISEEAEAVDIFSQIPENTLKEHKQFLEGHKEDIFNG